MKASSNPKVLGLKIFIFLKRLMLLKIKAQNPSFSKSDVLEADVTEAGKSEELHQLLKWNNRRALVTHNLIKQKLKASNEVQEQVSEVRRMGVFYIVDIITTVLASARMERQYYNANYVTYRGKGSSSNTEDFEERKNWVATARI